MPDPTVSFQFEAIGTRWVIDMYQPLDTRQSKELEGFIRRRIDQFDQVYSRFRADSIVTAMAQRAGKYRLPDDAEALLKLYRQLYDATGGAVTPLIGQVMADAGYDASYSLQPGLPEPPPAWDDVLDYQPPILHLSRPALLDFGAAGKGYLADIVSDLLTAQGIHRFCVDAGGDIVYRTDQPSTVDTNLRVGLEHPADPSLAIGVATIHNQSLCGSAGNRRAWGEYHHIIDPKSLESPRHIAALWVVADSGLLADGLATALFFAPAALLAKVFRFEYAILYADNSLESSVHFPAVFYT